MSGTVGETYLAALQHDIATLDGDERLVGVVRRPTGWFRSAVEENRPALGPPDDLLDEVQAARERLKRHGLCDEGAHNAAWEETDFADRYRAHLEESDAAREALADLADRVDAGEDVMLVCFEGEGKRCHRRLLAPALRERVERGH
ncbi:MAG: DUF488 family protein [Haloarculaceae archaeon]